jgi:hypothetical protein
MRRLLNVIVLATVAVAGAGCASSPDRLIQSGGGDGGFKPPPDGGGGDNNENLTTGDLALVFNNSGRSTFSPGLAAVRFSNKGTDQEQAEVFVDPKQPLGFKGPFKLDLYLRQPPNPDLTLGSNYNEYRRVTNTSDAELQYWQYPYSYAAQFRDVAADGSAWFFNGEKTTATQTGSATYVGKWTIDQNNTDFIEPYDTPPYTLNGYYRIAGDAAMTANFDAATFKGTLTPTYWETFGTNKETFFGYFDRPNSSSTPKPNESSDLLPAYIPYIRVNNDLVGKIDGNRITGTNCRVTCQPGDGGPLNNENPMYGNVFGPDGNEVTGVFTNYAIEVRPSGGDTAINDDLRAFIDIKGFFHGTKQ